MIGEKKLVEKWCSNHCVERATGCIIKKKCKLRIFMINLVQKVRVEVEKECDQQVEVLENEIKNLEQDHADLITRIEKIPVAVSYCFYCDESRNGNKCFNCGAILKQLMVRYNVLAEFKKVKKG